MLCEVLENWRKCNVQLLVGHTLRFIQSTKLIYYVDLNLTSFF